MDDSVNIPKINRLVLQNLIAGLSDGLILLENDGTIAWANRAALEMHRIEALSDLGENAVDYRRRFTLRYRNNHLLGEGQYPLERLLGGETFDEVTVEVLPSGDEAESRVHTVRGLILEDAGAKPDVLVLIIRDETPRFEAEARFESAFNANPAPGLICRLEDERFIRVNQGFLEMTGFTREEIIGISVEELGLFSACDTGEDALKRLHEGRVIRQREALIPIQEATGWSSLRARRSQLPKSPACSSLSPILMDAAKPRMRCARARSGSSSHFACHRHRPPSRGWRISC